MVLQAEGQKAMILAAGLGTRLKPLTDNKPKALVEWDGIPMLEHVILKLKSEGFTRIIINVHHYAEMIMEYISSREQFGIQIEFSHEKEKLLDNGGGIAKASWFLKDESFLVYNVDVNSNIDLGALYRAHISSGAIASSEFYIPLNTSTVSASISSVKSRWVTKRISCAPNGTPNMPLFFSLSKISSTLSTEKMRILVSIGITSFTNEQASNSRPIALAFS